jgi:hypothetical protein
VKAHSLCLLLAATGCLGTSSSDEEVPHLPTDSYFIYSDVEACLANHADDQRACSFSLALCSNGRAGVRTGDIVDDGDYEMDGPMIHGVLRGTSFTFDLQTGEATALGADRFIPDTAGRWQTLQFDTIDCSQPR